MGESSNASKSLLTVADQQEINEICKLLWGNNIKEDVFRRWSQGFEFSHVEPSALIQKQGGPCAVIAPLQAFLLKILLIETPGHNLSDLTPDKCKTLLIQAICNILMKCKDKKYRIVSVNRAFVSKNKQKLEEPEQGLEVTENTLMVIDEEQCDKNEPKINEVPVEWTPDQFHERLTVIDIDSIESVEKFLSENLILLTEKYGVLLLLYTVLLTKGIDNVLNELSDTSEVLIDQIYGHGSQALINLMLTGRAVAHVWDNDQDVGGLKLKGINQQADIGFITLMEQMQYCTVGSFFKNPKNPVWIMGSETHLTVLFSNEKRLVSPETPSEIARRIFRQFDIDASNFIASDVLQDVLFALDLVSEPEYVDIMKKKLDPEGLGIILMNDFMYEFYPEDKKSVPDTFDLMHYNGIPNSNIDCNVRYYKGTAILLESDLKLMLNISNPMLTCLQTKWPNIDVNWENSRTPSLN